MTLNECLLKFPPHQITHGQLHNALAHIAEVMADHPQADDAQARLHALRKIQSILDEEVREDG